MTKAQEVDGIIQSSTHYRGLLLIASGDKVLDQATAINNIANSSPELSAQESVDKWEAETIASLVPQN